MDMALMFLAALYFAPFMVAASRAHDFLIPILLANLVLGWTGIGWFAVLGVAMLTSRPAR
jgi:hypothetical protein